MGYAEELKNMVLKGYTITREDALKLSNQSALEICRAADELRAHFCGDGVDLCSITNGKSGRCTEDCKFCAQSSYFSTKIDEYKLLNTREIMDEVKYNERKGILRFSIVTSGKCLSDTEFEEVCSTYKEIQSKSGIYLCASHGLLNLNQFKELRTAGVKRYHNNLETSRRYFSNICSTHTYDEKLQAIRLAQEAGLEVCSGGIIGLGEVMEDRIDMVLDIRSLGIKSIPVNVLNPIKGTPLQDQPKLSCEEILKTIAIFRFLVPSGVIRLAGGRGLLEDKGRMALQSGANGAISGDMLTTSGTSIESDIQMTSDLGYHIRMV